eukprot:GHVP01038816.1.p1 GENE.GHVP01038816.1~~GHVP01038816.1.p1  ORF type:complete len:111 (+),score=18.96 GHVP01038816.1:113-445(+)
MVFTRSLHDLLRKKALYLERREREELHCNKETSGFCHQSSQACPILPLGCRFRRQKGIGAALHHVKDTEEEEPLAFASETLTLAEQNYSKWEREALAAVFAIRKWTTFYS